MCKAKHYTEELLEIYKNINSSYSKLKDELYHANQYEIDVLHMIENNTFNACEGYHLAKMLKDNRITRRQLKNEIETLTKLKENFIDKNMEQLKKTYEDVVRKDNILTELHENKVYNPRVLKQPELKVVPQNDNNTESKEMKYKKLNKVIVSLKQVENMLYYAEFKDKSKGLIKKKDIVNFDESKVVAI